MGVALPSMDSPGNKIKQLIEQLEAVQNENAQIHEAMLTLEDTNRLLKEENDAVKDVNKQLRHMIQKRPPHIPALPEPMPGFPSMALHGPHPAAVAAAAAATNKDGTKDGQDSGAPAPLLPYAAGGMYADLGYHGYGIPSHAAYYQEMLASHAKMEHDKYIQAREKVIQA